MAPTCGRSSLRRKDGYARDDAIKNDSSPDGKCRCTLWSANEGDWATPKTRTGVRYAPGLADPDRVCGLLLDGKSDRGSRGCESFSKTERSCHRRRTERAEADSICNRLRLQRR